MCAKTQIKTTLESVNGVKKSGKVKENIQSNQ